MRSRWVLGLGALLAVLAAGFLLVAPTYDSVSSGGPAGSGATLLEVDGPGVLVPLGVAVVLALGAWAAPWTWLRWTLVGLFCAGCVLALLSIGVFFLPAAAALVVGAALATLRPLRPTPGPAAWTGR